MRLTVQDALVYLCMPTEIVLLHDISTVPINGETVVFNGETFVVKNVINRFDIHHDGTLDHKIDIVCGQDEQEGIFYENPDNTLTKIR